MQTSDALKVSLSPKELARRVAFLLRKGQEELKG